MDYNTIISKIEAHIQDRGGTYPEWYVGIAANPKERLFTDHKVDKNNDKWIHDPADSETIARDVEKYFVYQRKTDGNPGGGDENTTHVYAYKKSPNTNP